MPQYTSLAEVVFSRASTGDAPVYVAWKCSSWPNDVRGGLGLNDERSRPDAGPKLKSGAEAQKWGRNPKVNAGPKADVRSKPKAVNAGPEPDAGPKPNAINAGLIGKCKKCESKGGWPASSSSLSDLSVIEPSVDEVDHVVPEYTPFAFCGGSVRSSCVGGLCRGAGRRPSKASLTKTIRKYA
ncbi:hypothetical protein CRG98_028128 [Punica granatum]|uniref:Uncharacterized protein n=1 Tax=Punica granatum TaxID=22663 RepID=A0A2I0J5G9_PUNGR|nr:hypothetical protein CRG98_028128 [Punica granatum]